MKLGNLPTGTEISLGNVPANAPDKAPCVRRCPLRPPRPYRYWLFLDDSLNSYGHGKVENKRIRSAALSSPGRFQGTLEAALLLCRA